MKRVIGIGGVFFKSEDPEALRAWYKKHLGIESESWGAVFRWNTGEGKEVTGSTSWSPFKKDTTYLDPSPKSYMINYRVEDLHGLIKILKEEGLEILGGPEDSEFGKFAWLLDPEGNKIELWEAPQGM